MSLVLALATGPGGEMAKLVPALSKLVLAAPGTASTLPQGLCQAEHELCKPGYRGLAVAHCSVYHIMGYISNENIIRP